jgi:predicted ArsR family transcriptional regulator
VESKQMTGMEIYDPRKAARRDGPLVSKEAAVAAAAFADTHSGLIVKTLKEHGPCGAEQIGDIVGMDAYRLRRRLPELSRNGFVQLVTTTDGVPITRKTATGRSERVWQAS